MGFVATAIEVLGNSHFEGWVAGPLMGVILAVAFAAMSKQKRGNRGSARRNGQRAANGAGRGDNSPLVQVVHHHHHHHGDRNGNGGDDGVAPLLIASVLVFSVCLLFFAAYLPVVVFALYFGITAVAMFCVTTFLIMLMSGQYSLSQHLNSAVLPVCFSACCLYVAVLARQNISPEVVSYAQNSLGTGPLTVSSVIGAAIAFLKLIGSEYATWMLFTMLSFVLVTIAALVAFGKCLHFVASVNVAASGASAWRFLEGRTRGVSGWGGTVALAVLLVGGWLFGDGTVFEWTRHIQR